MKALAVFRNGEPVCTAGTPAWGLVTALVSYQTGTTTDVAPLLQVSGFEIEAVRRGRRLCWSQTTLSLGDEVLIRVLDADRSDPPEVLPLEEMTDHDEAADGCCCAPDAEACPAAAEAESQHGLQESRWSEIRWRGKAFGRLVLAWIGVAGLVCLAYFFLAYEQQHGRFWQALAIGTSLVVFSLWLDGLRRSRRTT